MNKSDRIKTAKHLIKLANELMEVEAANPHSHANDEFKRVGSILATLNMHMKDMGDILLGLLNTKEDVYSKSEIESLANISKSAKLLINNLVSITDEMKVSVPTK